MFFGLSTLLIYQNHKKINIQLIIKSKYFTNGGMPRVFIIPKNCQIVCYCQEWLHNHLFSNRYYIHLEWIPLSSNFKIWKIFRIFNNFIIYFIKFKLIKHILLPVFTKKCQFRNRFIFLCLINSDFENNKLYVNNQKSKDFSINYISIFRNCFKKGFILHYYWIYI